MSFYVNIFPRSYDFHTSSNNILDEPVSEPIAENSEMEALEEQQYEDLPSSTSIYSQKSLSNRKVWLYWP
jgi:hypothetical protein